ncbi:MAG: sarcosine dehydrogenase [Pelagibacteraceae bacterium]|nr:sarcosine dehydrogenase [Pelagibacteraceae bacterium]
MNKKIPDSSRVVIIGGGVAGCSVAYHLAKSGWKDVTLLERDQLTSGSTWHAAGLIGQLGASASITKLRKYSLDLYKNLEKITGQSTGLKQNGSVTVATNNDRMQELLRQATTAQLFDVDVEILEKNKIREHYPIINDDDLVGAVRMPMDGQANPVDVTQALAKAARMEGARIVEHAPVKKILIKNKSIEGVETSEGIIKCEYIVLAAGMWSRQIGKSINVNVPLYPDEHFYILTEPIENLTKNLPVLRDYNNCLYIKEDAGKLLVGLFEPNAKPAFTKNNIVPDDFSFGTFSDDWDHFEPYMMAAIKRIPVLEKAGIRQFLNGPESFTPDNNYMLGEIPEIKNFFVCCGFNSIGIVSAGGAGKVTAEWIINGGIQEDLFSLDVSRFEPWQSEIKYLVERSTETLGNLYAMHWPYKQFKTARNIKLLSYHEELKKEGACFGVGAGYERPLWYAKNDEVAEDKYSFNYQNWYPAAERESKATRNNVALFELTPFAKFEITGKDSHKELQIICSNNISNNKGKTTYTQMLNKYGGIEADLSVTCLEEDKFLITTGSAVRYHDKHWIEKNIGSGSQAKLSDVTEDYNVIGIMGPNSRKLLSLLSSENFETIKFPFGTGKNIFINNIKIWAQRLSYVGELGWELFIPTENAKEIYKIITNIGKKYELTHAGTHTMDILRMEKGYLHWGHDISPEENPFEVGLNMFVSFKKREKFIGREKMESIEKKGCNKKLVYLTLDQENNPGNPLLLHEEPIYMDEKIVGKTSSGQYSFYYKKSISMGHITLAETFNLNEIKNNKFEIEVAKKRYLARLNIEPLHDAKNILIRK